MALPHHQPRAVPRLQLPGHAADGRRRALRHRRQPPQRRGPGRGHRRAAVGVPARRGAAGDQRHPPHVGPRRRLLDRRRGRRAHLPGDHRLPARRARRPDGAAGAGVRRGRHRRPEARQRPVHRPPDRRDRVEQCPRSRPRRGHRGGVAPLRRVAAEPRERQGLHPRLRRPHRRAPVDLPHHPAARPVRARDVAERLRRLHREHRHLDQPDRRRGARHRLPPHRDPHRRLLRRPPARRQPVRREPRRRRPRDRRAALALPVRAPSHLGLRRAVPADPRRHHRRRPRDQGGGPARQAGVGVRVRPRHRRAGLAHRGAAGAGGERSRRVVLAHPSRSPPSPRPSSGRGSRSTS